MESLNVAHYGIILKYLYTTIMNQGFSFYYLFFTTSDLASWTFLYFFSPPIPFPSPFFPLPPVASGLRHIKSTTMSSPFITITLSTQFTTPY